MFSSRLALWVPVVAAVFTGCVELPRDQFPVAGHACTLALDQRAAFIGRVAELPIEVRFDPGFPTSEHADIMQAINEWNDFGRSSLGLEFFKVVDEEPDQDRLPNGIAYCRSDVKRVPGVRIARISSESEWNRVGEGGEAGAITAPCSNGEPGKQAEKSITFHISEPNDEAIVAEALHELGHVLGLGHSCASHENEHASKFFLSCKDLPYDHPYHQAVMYPEISLAKYRITDRSKLHLRANDMERTYCLYANHHPKPVPAAPAAASGASAASGSSGQR